MPVTYTNRRGVTYVLCQGLTATGKTRYYFARESVARETGRTPLDAMPEGYEIRENVNGIVSLGKVQPPQLRAEEIKAVALALARNPKGHLYRQEAKARVITLFEQVETEPAIAARGMAALFGLDALEEARWLVRTIEYQRKYSRFEAVMRFTLMDQVGLFQSRQRLGHGRSLRHWGTASVPPSVPGSGVCASVAPTSPDFEEALMDQVRRLFRAERMCYRGSLYGWLVLAEREPIDDLARRYIPALGTDHFFELIGWPAD